MTRISEIIYKVQFSKLCIDALLKRPKTTHRNLDIMLVMFLLLAFNRGLHVLKEKHQKR